MVPTKEPDEVCHTTNGQEVLFRSPTPTLPGLRANHPHTQINNIDTKTSITDVAKKASR
jgi:hypothetical protein